MEIKKDMYDAYHGKIKDQLPADFFKEKQMRRALLCKIT